MALASALDDRRPGPYPVVLYSPGGEADGGLDTGLVEDLVSHGYVVVTMDDTNESPEVEFPGGRLVTTTFVPPPHSRFQVMRARHQAQPAR